MNGKLSAYMTTLGVATLAFYGAMMALGILSVEFRPQFAISAILFLSSGKIMRKVARSLTREETEEEGKAAKPQREEPDWPWLTGLLNWTAALLIVGIMAIFLMKPIGVTFEEALSFTMAHDHFVATAVP